jgi:predicted nucleic acid-binding protein
MTLALLDTNVILDALLDRQPWSADAKALWQAHLNNQFAAHVTATSLTDIFHVFSSVFLMMELFFLKEKFGYISRRHAGKDRAWLAIQACLDQLYVISVGFNELQIAATLGDSDFEDNLQIACAMTAQLDVIVTRDFSGFAASSIPVLTPQQMLATLSDGN